MANIALETGAQDPSQLNATMNALISNINALLGQTSPTVQGFTIGTTSATLPAYSKILLSSTVANAAYKLAAPVTGQSVTLMTKSTLSQTVTLVSGNFFASRTKLTFKTTNVGLPQAAELFGRSSSVWAIVSMTGNAKCT